MPWASFWGLNRILIWLIDRGSKHSWVRDQQKTDEIPLCTNVEAKKIGTRTWNNARDIEWLKGWKKRENEIVIQWFKSGGISSLIALGSEKMLDMISVFLKLPRLVLWPNMWCILENVSCALEKNVYSAAFGSSVSYIQKVHVGNKNKNKQMGPNETEKLLHSKGNHKQDQKTTLRMGENICKPINRQRINLQNLQAAHAAQ